jgi:hypothetical protein
MIWGCFAVRERSVGKGTFLLETGVAEAGTQTLAETTKS